MLRSPLEALAAHRITTIGVIVAVATSLWLVAALGASVVQAQTSADGWWEGFLPVVYLDPGAGQEKTNALADEIEEWAQVASVEVEGPDQAMERLEEQLGADEVRDMGVDETMMPTSLVVHPHLWRSDQVEVIANAEALEVRSEVVGVDAPRAGALDWLDGARIVLVGLALAVFLALLSSLVAMTTFLRRIQAGERRENHLLEVFGASRSGLRRPTLWRGLVLGTSAGFVAAIGFLPWALLVDGLAVDVVGSGAFSAVRAGLWSCALIGAGLAIGVVVGWFGGRRPRRKNSGGMKGLLDWEREEL